GTITAGDTTFFPLPASGILASGNDNKISNLAGGTISVGQDASGIFTWGDRTAISNAGTIMAGDTTGCGCSPATGIAANGNDNTISNLAGGLISVGFDSAGIFSQGDRVAIGNAGRIIAKDGGVGITAQG